MKARMILVLVLVLAVSAATGCIHRVVNKSTAENLLRTPSAPVAPEKKISVCGFFASERPPFDLESRLHGTFRPASPNDFPGQKDEGFQLAAALLATGCGNVEPLYVPDADYYVMGFYGYPDVPGRGVAWLVWDGLMALPAVFLPVPWGTSYDGRIMLSIYDSRQQKPVAVRTTYARSTVIGFSIWGFWAATSDRRTPQAAANLLVRMLNDLETKKTRE